MADVNEAIEKWHINILTRATKRALVFLSHERWLKQSSWYLAGGTALALRVGHRQSRDLDFFSPRDGFSAAAITKHFPRGSWVTYIQREGTLDGTLFGAKMSFIAYPFFVPQEPVLRYGSVRVLPPRDIAVMKIIAVSQRGSKRDFVDLYWYVQRTEPLIEVIRRLPKQYPTVAHDYHHILKSLMYFEDAESDPLPKLFFPADWRMMKAYFRREVPKVARKLLKLEK